jgi:autotransporter-associated beta strand protein
VVNKLWTNNLNWNATPHPSGNETATFTNSLAGKLQEIDIDGFIGCTNVVFDNAGIAHYRIGTNATLQTFILRRSTTGSIIVTGTAGSNQTFNSILQLGADAVAGTYVITNGNTARTLTFLGAITNGTGGAAGTKTLNINGTGPVVATGGINSNSTLNVNVNSTAAVTIGGPNTINTLTRNLTGALTITGASKITTLTQNSTGALAINADSTIDFVTQSALGTITLTNTILKTLNMNVANGIVNIAAGATLTFTNAGGDNLIGSQDATINGPGVILLSNGNVGDYANNYAGDGKTLTINAKITGARGLEYYNAAATSGTFVLTAENDYTLDTVFNKSGTLRFATLRNKGVACNLGRGNAIRFKDNGGGRIHYVGIGDTTDRDMVFKNTGFIEQSGPGVLKFTGPFYLEATPANSIITLQGSSTGSGEISGPISNNHATVTLGVTKAGTGIWTLSAENFYKGPTTVNGGILAIAGSAASITNSSGLILASGGTLKLLNSFSANHANRLRDTMPITMNGGIFEFFNNGGVPNYSETIGAVTINVGNNNVITASRAALGSTSTLTISSLARNAGALVFRGDGLGDDARNRIFIIGQADGLIGSWATVNGTAYAAYSSARGVYAADGTVADSTDIAARGPDSIIPEGTALKVRIATDGVSGAIELTNTITTITSLLQATGIDSVVNTAGKTLRTWTLAVPEANGNLTIGQNSGDGFLAPNQEDATITLNNGGDADITINAVVANNGGTAHVTKIGSGVTTLTAENTFTGDTAVYEGSLVLANSNALQNSRVTRDGIVFDSSISSHRFLIGNLTNGYTSLWYKLDLTDNAGTPVTLAVGNNNLDSVYSGNLGGNGVFEKVGAGSFRITGTVDHNGGTKVSEGRLIAGSQDSLGFGPVTDNAILDLTVPNVTYRGLANALSGNGTVNVLNLGTGQQTVTLNGNYSGFTGVWNIGPNTVANGGRIQMNGLDNPAATINMYTNAFLYTTAAVTHYATINLHGGDTGESLGQLRLENGIWAGPVNLKAATTNVADALIGGNGVGTISGVIDDAGADILLDRAGTSTTVLTGANTYGGPTWVKQGTLQVPWCGNTDSTSSPLGKSGKVMLGLLASAGRLQYNGTNDVSNRPIEMAGTTATAYLTHIGAGTWTMTGNITSPLAGNKQLYLEGNVGTTGVLAGVISDSLTSTNNIYKNQKGTWVLAGDNTFHGPVTIYEGSIIAKHSNAFGIGPKTVTEQPDATPGRNVTLCFDGSDGDLTIPSNIGFIVSGLTGALINLAGNNTVQGNVVLTSGGGESLFTSQAGKLTIAGDVFANINGRILRFRGDADGEISGVISNGATITGLPLWKESGTGSWLFSGNNTYTGTTTVTSGRIAVGGVNGRIALGAGIIINGGAFAITNSLGAYLDDRVADGNRVTMSGGTLSYDHPDVGEQPYSETLGVLAISSGINTVRSSQAAADWNSTLIFSSLSRTGGTIDFVGTGLGDNSNARNRIKINGQPDGLIGTWATVNGTSFAAYDSSRGVYAADPVTPVGIAAKGETITNDAMATVEITLEGAGETNVLEGATENSVNILKQASEWPSTIFMPGKTLKVADVVINAGQAALTIGQSVNEGLMMGLNASSFLDLVNDSTTALTINAGVTNNGTAAMGLMKWGSGSANIAGRASYTGQTIIEAGTLEFSSSINQVLSGAVVNKSTLKLSGLAPQMTFSGAINNTGSIAISGLTNTLSGVISGSGTLTKSGDGQLTLSAANTYTGDITITGGTVISGNNAALGTVDGETIINGGTLAFSAARDHGAERVKVQGAGVDNMGAIVNYVAASYNAFRFVTLTADTTFGGTQRWDIRAAGTPLTASFDMGGYTLTKTNSNEIALQNVKFENPGNFIVNQGLLRVEFSTTLGGSAANLATVKAGATLEAYNLYQPVDWSLSAEEGAILSGANTQSATQNVWNGSVSLNGKAYLNCGGFQTFNGAITNTGSIVKTGGSTAFFNNSANAYAGTTIVSNGTLYAKYPGSLPGYNSDRVTVNPAAMLQIAVATNGSAFGWTSAEIGAISTSAFVLSNSWLAVETFADFDHLSLFPSSFGLRKLGVGTMTIPDNQTILGGLFVQNGGLVLNDIIWNTAQITTEMGLLAGESGSLTLSGNSVLAAFQNTNNAPNAQSLVVGRAGRAMLVLKDNAVVTNRLYMGDATTSAGAVYQSGNSTMYNWGGTGNDGRLGYNGYGYYELNSGTFTNHGYFQLGCGSTTGTGVLIQKGGMFYQNNTYGGQFALNRGGTGIVYTDGGRFGTVNQIALGESSGASTTSGNAIFTADGNAIVNIAGNISLSDRINAFSAFNLNGGTVTANQFTKGNRTGNSAFVNFDGGTFKSRVNGALFTTGLTAPTAVTIFGGGAIFDTGAFSNTVDVALLAPTGKCVSAISISQGSGYIGSPAVIVSGGGGAGATALASFDSANGTVTGIQITSPGAGYTSTPTVTLTGGGCTNVAAVVTGVMLANHVSGGLTKNGSGTLTLAAANTYTGPTVLNEGVLRLGAPGAIHMDSDIIINGGILDLNGYTLVTRATVTVNAGVIVNGIIVSESLDKTTTSTATLGGTMNSLQPISIAAGTYKLGASTSVQPGLFQGKFTNNANDLTSINPCTSVTSSPAMGNTQTIWGDRETYVYTGYIWNRSLTNATWTFAEHFDDNVLLRIDGITVLNNTGAGVPSLANYVLTPGPHTFEVRFGENTGVAGPSQTVTWFPANHTFGLGVDYSGRGETNIAYFASMVDPGDGTLFTTALPAFSENTAITLEAGATLDLNGTTQIIANLSGSGTVTNGTLVITGLVTPAGDAIGALTFDCNLTLTGKLLLDVSASENDRLIVSGNLDVSLAEVEVLNALTMPKQNYTIATANGTITGSPSGDFIPWIGNPDEKSWKVKQQGTTIKLIYLGGTIIMFH